MDIPLILLKKKKKIFHSFVWMLEGEEREVT